MKQKTITVSEAIKQGYLFCVIEDDEFFTLLEDLEELTFIKTEITLIGKHPSYEAIKPGRILEKIKELAEDDITSVFDDLHCHDNLAESIEDIFSSPSVIEAEELFIQAIQFAIKENNAGCFMPEDIKLVFE